MPSVAIVYYSAQGHTHELAEAVKAGAEKVEGTTVELIRLKDADIQNGRWSNAEAVKALNLADAIVFGTPTYMGGYSAQMKAFIDGCGGIWYQQGWKDKVAAGFTHSSGLSGDKLATLSGLWINAMQHSMLWVSLGRIPEGSTPDKLNRISSFSGAMAQSNQDQPKVGDGDKATAALLGTRVAEATARWMKAAPAAGNSLTVA